MDEIFNVELHEKSHRSDTIASEVDPLDSSKEKRPESEKLAPVNSGEAESQQGNIQSPDNNSQYTLDSHSEKSHAIDKNPVALTEDEPSSTVVRRKSSIASAKDSVIEFNKRKPFIMILTVYLKIYVAFLAFLSIYWGSFYKRNERYAHMKFLVVVEDEEFDGIPPYFGSALNETLATTSEYGDWVIYDAATFGAVAAEHDNTLEAEFYRQIHHQNYWGGFRLKPNSTYNLYKAMVDLNTSFVDEYLIECVYETGRDALGMSSYVEPNLKVVQAAIINATSQGVYEPLIMDQLDSAQRINLIANASAIITTKSFLKSVDYRPLTVPVAIGSSLMGLVYCLVLSFHQFNFAARLHAKLIEQLKQKDFIFVRLVSSQVTFVLLSFLYCIMTLAFQIPVTTTFGKSGFLVLWGTMCLYFSALGGINENAAVFITSRNRIYIGFWIVFFIVSNVSPTFYPMALCPKFFRYGYALPMHAAHEIAGVIFFNTWKGNLGKEYAILAAWAVLANILLPFTIKNSQKHLAKVAAAEAEKSK